MTFAICLQVPNHLHFKKYLNIYAEFIPQILFMHSIFGYLVLCIIYKWSIDWTQSPTGPPGLLNMLIYMFLSPGTIDPKTQLYTGQGFVQVVLLLIALVCVPWMLCLKPYMLWKEHQQITAQGYHGLVDGNGRPSEEDGDEEEGVGQAVSQETDEDHVSSRQVSSGQSSTYSHSRWATSSFTKSSTQSNSALAVSPIRESVVDSTGSQLIFSASYLRLWALSLAHAQLSEVLYSMTLENAFLQQGSGIVAMLFLVAMFAMWFNGTLGILVTMEVSPLGSP